MRHGMHCLMYSVMGAHPDVQDGTTGTRFAVWAPNAREVSIVCDANHWQHGRNPLRLMIRGEIVSLKPNFPAAGQPTLAITGLNLLHRLRTLDVDAIDPYVDGPARC